MGPTPLDIKQSTGSLYPSGIEEVNILRRFWDEHLLTNVPGRAFVRFYYRNSPPVDDFIRDREPLKAIARTGLKPIVWVAEKVTD